jgi:aminotransferase
MRSIPDRIKTVSSSGIREFFELVMGMPEVISLAVGEPDFVTPWHIREACIASLESGYTSYTSNWGLLELRELLSEKMHDRYGVDYDPSNEILITSGVSEAFDVSVRAIMNQGDEVLIFEPCYVSYAPCVIFAGGMPVKIPTRRSNGFKPTPEQIEDNITDKTNAIVLSYPNNPTGSTMCKKELGRIADVVNEHDLLVISDEIYGELTYEGEHTCFASLEGMRERTIVLNGFSKSHAMTGWRIGYAMGNNEIIKAMLKIHQYTMLCAPITAQMAAVEALKNGDDAVKEMVSEYNRRRRFIVHGLNGIGLECLEPKGAFYAFPSVEHLGFSSDEFAEMLLRQQHVAVIPGSVFGAPGEGFVRCSYATSMDALKEALLRIGSFLDSIQK